MAVIRIFGAILLLLGFFLMYGMIQSSLPIFFGKKISAKIIGLEKKKDKRFGYVNYPIIEFNYNGKIVKYTDDRSSHDQETISNPNTFVYHHESYGTRRDFEVFEIIFSIIGVICILFGFIALFKR